jgi:hypothetical protein
VVDRACTRASKNATSGGCCGLAGAGLDFRVQPRPERAERIILPRAVEPKIGEPAPFFRSYNACSSG